MGGGFSIPAKAPPIIREDVPPFEPGSISFGVGDSQGCAWNGKECQLTVARGISSSGAKLYREQGTVTKSECDRLSFDMAKVTQGQMAFNEFKANLLAGKYFATSNGPDGQYCRQLLFSSEDLKKLTDMNQIPWGSATVPAIRKMSASGGFSSITKLFIKPSIPFKVTFNGETYTVPIMTLFHPSPIRVENVQHDAMLTLGDPGEGNQAKGNAATDAVILIPLVGSLNAGPSGDFLSKIARYLSAVTQPDPATGQYKTIDIPTGNDWDLSKMFPGSPIEGATVVDTGYFIWSASPSVVRATTPEVKVNPYPQADLWTYRYNPAGPSKLRYIMLQKPVGVNVFDMQTIRMLPATPSDQALDSYLPKTLAYVTPKTCEAPPAGRESMTNQGTCDPFANVSAATNGSDRTEMLIKVIIGTLTTFGVLLAVYFALKLFTNKEWGFKLPRWGVLAGNFMVNAPVDKTKQVPPPPTFVAPDIDVMFGSKAEERLSKVKSTSDNPMVRAKAHADAIEKAGREAEAEAKQREDDMAKAIEASRLEAEAQAERDKAQSAEDAKLEAELDAEEQEREAKRAAEEEVLRRHGPAGTGLDFTDEQLAQNAEVERARVEAEAAQARDAERARLEAENVALAPQGRPGRRTRAQLTPTVGPSAMDKALAKKEAETAKLQKEVDATKALFEAARGRKEAEEAKAKDAVEASIRKEKEALEAAEEARIKAESERVAASASDVASKTLKRRTVKSSDRDLAQAEAKLAAAEAERKRQVAEYEQKQKEAILASEPGADGRASAGVPTAKGERPPAAPLKGRVATSSSDAMAVSHADSLKGQINATLASIGKQEVFINANPPTKEHPNRIFNQRLETRLNASLKTLDSQLSELEALVAKFPADKGLERMGMTRFIKQTQEKEKKSLSAQNQRFEVLGKIIKEGPAMKGGRRRKRRSTRRYVA